MRLRYARQLVVVILGLLIAVVVADAYAYPRRVRLASGIQGVMYAHPGGIADPPCPPPPGRTNCLSFPYTARIPVRLRDGHRIVAVIRANSKGRFRVRLKPGWYVLMPRTTIDSVGLKIVPRRAQIRVRVRRGAYRIVMVEYLSFPLPS